MPTRSHPVSTESTAEMAAWREGELEECNSCPGCGGRSGRPLHADLSDRTFRSAPGTWTIWRCEGCGAGYLNPRPTPTAIMRAYESYYTHADCSEWWMREQPTVTRRVAMRLVHGRLNSRLGYDRRPALRAGAALLRLLVRRDRELLGHMRYLHARPGGRLLDVGCGDGAYLSLLRSLGWTTTVGVDPDPTAVQMARDAGINVRLGTLDDVALPAESFDAITLNHSIEHVHHPAGLLKECRRLLAPRGELIVFTPNLDSDGHRCFGRNWFHLDPPRHLVIFTPASLRHALQAAGFNEIKQLPPRLRGASALRSSALRADADPLNPPPLSLRMRVAGGLSNLRTLHDPDRAEEVALSATR
jgi:2-polyprenyl-3-methyl-5-hydroxy-6-metoxy-1,4-benzoquinol methylase